MKKKPAKKAFKLIGKQLPGRMSKMNAPRYKVPKTPKRSGLGWGG